MSLVTLAGYKSALKIENATEDAKISQYGLEVEQCVKSFLGFDIEEAVYTNRLYDGNGTNYLYPRDVPVTEITKIEVYGGLASDGSEDWEEWEQNDEYERILVEDNGSVIYMQPKFPAGKNNIRLKYTAGYSSGTLPQDIQSVCKKLVKLLYLEIDKGYLGFTSTSQSAGNSVADVLEPDKMMKILKEIEHYRLQRI